jgi:hypothetical protein
MILLDTVPEESRTMTWLAAAGFSFTLQLWEDDILADGLENNHV